MNADVNATVVGIEAYDTRLVYHVTGWDGPAPRRGWLIDLVVTPNVRNAEQVPRGLRRVRCVSRGPGIGQYRITVERHPPQCSQQV